MNVTITHARQVLSTTGSTNFDSHHPTVRAVGDRDAGGAIGDGHHGAPLAEAGALLVVGGGAVGEVIEALAPGLGGVGKGPEALFHQKREG